MFKLRSILSIILFIAVLFSSISGVKAQIKSDLDDDTLFLAATIWGESQSYGVDMKVVANTVMNRKKYYEYQSGNDQPLSIKSIVSNTEQYASWKGKDWSATDIIKNIAEYQGSDKQKWETCVNIAKQALSNTLNDITGGATGYYHADTQIPEWARGSTSTTVIGSNVVVRGAKMEDLVDSQNNVIVQGGSSSAWSEYASTGSDASSQGETCGGITSPARDIDSSTNSGHGVLSDKTMQNMTNMLDRIYKNLGRVFMLGHGLLCYASKVAYTCFGLDVPNVVSACYMKMPDLSFFISGLAIYFIAFLMSIAIGMYFIDVCFKLGFALMYLPIAIALWPFAPTKSKFGEAFGMIVHNAMIYALMSIGLSYAILLIYNGVLGDASNWSTFWEAIEKESSEILAEKFSIGATRVIVILFSLIFGFKIIQATVDDYVNQFFSDGLMSGQSPMHHLGTQAFHMSAVQAVTKAGSYATDVASTQLGKGIEAVGDEFIKLSDGDYGTISKIASSIITPIRRAPQYINKVIGDDTTPDATPPSGGPTGPAPSSGGPKQSNQATTSSAPVELFDRQGKPIYSEYMSDQFLKENADRYELISGTSPKDRKIFDKQNNQEVPSRFEVLENGKILDAAKGETTTAEEYNHELESIASKENKKSLWAKFNEATTPDNKTLRPKNIISKTSSVIGDGLSVAAHTIVHPQKTFRTVKNLVTEGVSSENSPYKNGTIIITNTGKVLFRKLTPDGLTEGLSSENSLAENAGTFAVNAATQTVKVARATARDAIGTTGGIIKDLGHSMQQNYKDGSEKESWLDSITKDKLSEEDRKREEQRINSDLASKYDEES